jgi:hypothetical protein
MENNGIRLNLIQSRKTLEIVFDFTKKKFFLSPFVVSPTDQSLQRRIHHWLFLFLRDLLQTKMGGRER